MSKTKVRKKLSPKKDLAKFMHDLRTPLSVMRMSLDIFEMSKEYKKSRKVNELIKTMDKQLDKLLQIIKDF